MNSRGSFSAVVILKTEIVFAQNPVVLPKTAKMFHCVKLTGNIHKRNLSCDIWEPCSNERIQMSQYHTLKKGFQIVLKNDVIKHYDDFDTAVHQLITWELLKTKE